MPPTTSASGGGASSAGASSATGERLAQLQNLVKRDPEAYREEFLLQQQHYLAELELLRLAPGAPADDFVALVHFQSHVAPCYRAATAALAPQLMALLGALAEALTPHVRRGVAQALILLRNRGMVEAVPLARLFFALLRVRDRQLRELVRGHIVHDVRNLNAGRRDEATNRAIQGLIYGVMREPSVPAAHRALMVMTELYRRHVWRDAKTVNAIAAALLSPHAKLLVAALNFFLGIGSDGSNDVDDDDEGSDGAESSDDGGAGDESLDAKKMRRALSTHAHSKHTKKRQRQTERMIAGLKKNQRKAAAAAGPAFPAIQLVHDPQGIAEKLFARLRGSGERCVPLTLPARARARAHHQVARHRHCSRHSLFTPAALSLPPPLARAASRCGC